MLEVCISSEFLYTYSTTNRRPLLGVAVGAGELQEETAEELAETRAELSDTKAKIQDLQEEIFLLKQRLRQFTPDI